jgi:hypothetical protein
VNRSSSKELFRYELELSKGTPLGGIETNLHNGSSSIDDVFLIGSRALVILFDLVSCLGEPWSSLVVITCE